MHIRTGRQALPGDTHLKHPTRSEHELATLPRARSTTALGRRLLGGRVGGEPSGPAPGHPRPSSMTTSFPSPQPFLVWWKMSLLIAGGWNQMIFKVPSNPTHSVVLWLGSSGPAGDVPAHGRGVGTRRSLRSLPTQTSP